MTTRKRYTKEFKLDAISLVQEQCYSIAEAARSLDIHPNMLSRWIKEAEQDDGYAFLVKSDDEYDDVMYFSEVKPEVLKIVNLQSEDNIGVRFEITYEIEEFEEEDEYGYTEVYEKYTIIKIKKM